MLARPTQGSTIPVALLLACALAAAAHAQQAPRVALATAERAPLVRELTLSGHLSSPRRARLAPAVSGRVTDLAVDAGDRVAAGDRLLKLDAELDELQREQAEAALAEARARLSEARRRFREARDLAQRDSISRSELEGRRSEVERLEAVVARRQSELAYRAGVVKRHTLNAPFAGVVSERMIDLGERAATEQPVLELVASEGLRLDLAVPQAYYGVVVAGTSARIRIDAQTGEPIETPVDKVIPVSDDNSRTFLARIGLDNTGGDLIPGMSARAVLRVDTGRSGVVIPPDALIRYPDGRKVVFVAEGDGESRTVREQRVATGLEFGQRVAISDGLEAGTAVVTAGNEALQDGQQVRIADDS
jgi:RND family efflux transporter MFP subunit